MYKISTHHKHPQGKVFSWMALILGLGVGLSLPIFPNFVKEILQTDGAVSIFYSAMAVVIFLAAMASTIVLRKVERTIMTKISLFASGAAFLFLMFATHFIELAILNTIRIWFTLFLVMTLALFVRDFANEQNLGQSEGRYYKYNNIGYLLGPLIGGFIGNSMDYEIVFFISSMVMIGGLLYFHYQHIILKHQAITAKKETAEKALIKNIKTFFSNPERVKAYFTSFFLISWIMFKRIYVPLYVVMSGYLESVTGLILAFGIIPLIFFEEKIGKYGDTHGIRLPMSIGFLVFGATLLTVFISPYPILNFALFMIGNVGVALIEPLQESFLFKNTPKEEEENLYGVYLFADSFASFLTPLFGALILVFLPFNYLFLIFGIMLLAVGVWCNFKFKA